MHKVTCQHSEGLQCVHPTQNTLNLLHLPVLVPYFFCLKNWFPSPLSWVQTPPKRLVSSNDTDFTKRELLAWRRCRNPTFGSRALFATQNHGFVSQEGRGMPLPICDTKPEVRIMQIVHLQNHGFVSQVGRGPTPCLQHNTTVLCRKQGGAHPAQRRDLMPLEHLPPPKKQLLFFSLTRTAKMYVCQYSFRTK